jgi:hypothetical protein
MGGFTKIVLKEKDRISVDNINIRMDLLKIPKKFRFHSGRDVRFEYEAFKLGLGVFEERFFPKDKINNFVQFQKYWSTEALGEVFVPKKGTLTLDSYFGRTSDYAMKKVLNFVCKNIDEIESVGGSFGTMVEKVASKKQEQMLLDSGLIRLKVV